MPLNAAWISALIDPPGRRQMRALSVQGALHSYAGWSAARWVEPGIAGPPTTRRTLAPRAPTDLHESPVAPRGRLCCA